MIYIYDPNRKRERSKSNVESMQIEPEPLKGNQHD